MTALTKKRVTLKEAETEVLRVMKKVCRNLAYTYRFASHDASDLEQEGYYESLRVINNGSYDVSRPLENFLRVHINRRLYNFKRKYSVRIEGPCKCCDVRDPINPCKRWLDWYERNVAKQNILQPIDIQNVMDEDEPSMRHESVATSEATAGELEQAIDTQLPVELRGDYLKMMAGQAIPKHRRAGVQKAIRELLLTGGYLDGKEEKWLASQDY